MNSSIEQHHSEEAEQSALGAALSSENALHVLMSTQLAPEAFYHSRYREVYLSLLRLYDTEDNAIDLVNVINDLRSRKVLNDIGGAYFVTGLQGGIPTATHIDSYIQTLREKWSLRRLMKLSRKIEYSIEKGYNAKKILSSAEIELMDIHDGEVKKGFRPYSEVMVGVYESLDKAHADPDNVSMIRTGFLDIDKYLNGMDPGDLVILAARPSMGKTALALNIARYNSTFQPVGIFSLEMGANQLATRMLTSEAEVDGNKARIGKLNNDEFKKLLGTNKDIPIYIDDSTGISPSEIRAKSKRLIRKHNAGLIIVDYLQLMDAGIHTDSREREVATMTRALKNAAKSLNVPILLLSQLSRRVEHRQDKRPVLSDLRESGAIEQDADIVMFIYRDDYYDQDSDKKGLAEISIAKHRNGPTGRANLLFKEEFTRFENYYWDDNGQTY